MKWIKIKDRLPKADKMCLFIQWHDVWQQSINEYIGTLQQAETYREYELKYTFTHWCYITKPKKI